MSGSFSLILDTTPPITNVVAPNFANVNSSTEFVINSNELLDSYQDFYFIDASGERHDVIFQHDGYQFIGHVNFSGFSTGIATFHGTVKDDVLNPSPFMEHSINLMNRTLVKMEIREGVRLISVKDSGRNTEFEDSTRNVETSTNQRNISQSDYVRKIEVNEVDN